jgi:uncharacterized RDD family membrane protein YckC
MKLYISRDGERVGPYSVEQVNRQLAAGTLSPHDLGWSESSPGWKPLLSFAGVIVPGGASSTAAPIGLATPVPMGLPQFAGFWIRGLALIIDMIIVGSLVLLTAVWLQARVAESAGPLALATVPQALLVFFYMPVLWFSPLQATIGQRLCHLRVTDGLGGRITFTRAVVRVIAMTLSGLILGIGFLMAAFTERKRALHDILADTCVIKWNRAWA